MDGGPGGGTTVRLIFAKTRYLLYAVGRMIVTAFWRRSGLARQRDDNSQLAGTSHARRSLSRWVERLKEGGSAIDVKAAEERRSTAAVPTRYPLFYEMRGAPGSLWEPLPREHVI